MWGEERSQRAQAFNKVVKQAPLFWLPWFYYPIQENGRATGFLIPSFNIAPGRGVDLEPAFFWAMGRSMDQTFSYEFRPGLTPRIGHEFRYVRSERNRGTFVSYFFPPQKAGTTVAEGLPAPSTKWEYDLDWSAQEMLPLGFRSQLKVKLVSEQNQIQDSFFRTAGRNRRDGSLVLTRDTALGALQIEARSSFVARNRRDELFTKLPSVSLTALPKRLGHTGLLWKYELHGDRFVKDEDYFLRGENGEKTHEAYNRYDAMTEISRPYAVSYLTVTPSLSTRYTLYSASLATVGPDQLAVGDPLDRRYVRGEVRLAGPNLSRVFANPFRGYTDRFKHVIGPEVIWSFNSHVGRADAVPQLGAFDTIDNIFATNQIQYGLAQTLWARRPGPSRKLAPYQVLSWRVYQTYYFNLKDAHLRYDPSYGTRALGPGDVPARRSPIRSELRLTLSRNVMANWTVQYDVNFKQLSQSSLNASLHNARGSLDAYWSRFELLTDKIEDRESFDNYTARGWVDVLPKRLKLTGEGAYNGSQKLLQYYGLGGQVNVQCFGLMLNLRKTSIGNGEYRSQFGFAIQLGGLGSIGMDPTAGGSTFRGMR